MAGHFAARVFSRNSYVEIPRNHCNSNTTKSILTISRRYYFLLLKFLGIVTILILLNRCNEFQDVWSEFTAKNFLRGRSKIKQFVRTYRYTAGTNLQVLYKQIENLDHGSRQQYFKSIAIRDQDFQIKLVGISKDEVFYFTSCP